MTAHEVISLTEVTKKFPIGVREHKVAVDNLSLGVEKGRIVGLLGPNGSGKSTTLKMILGFLKPTKGQILIGGLPSGNLEARRQIGYLPENPRFPKFLTGKDLLFYYGRLFGMSRLELKKRSDELLELVGLKHATKQRVSGYSKGMTQRLAIAQALINKPQILIFDEPMSGLDPIGRMEIRNLIWTVHEQLPDSTIFFSTHILGDVEQLCSHVALLRAGKLATFCSIESLLKDSHEKFDIMTSQIPKKLMDELFSDAPHRETPLGVTLTVQGVDSLMAGVKSLQSNQFPILGITGHRRTLEEALFKHQPEELQ